MPVYAFESWPLRYFFCSRHSSPKYGRYSSNLSCAAHDKTIFRWRMQGRRIFFASPDRFESKIAHCRWIELPVQTSQLINYSEAQKLSGCHFYQWYWHRSTIIFFLHSYSVVIKSFWFDPTLLIVMAMKVLWWENIYIKD